MFILFFLVWVIFNGKLTVEIAIFGGCYFSLHVPIYVQISGV